MILIQRVQQQQQQQQQHYYYRYHSFMLVQLLSLVVLLLYSSTVCLSFTIHSSSTTSTGTSSQRNTVNVLNQRLNLIGQQASSLRRRQNGGYSMLKTTTATQLQAVSLSSTKNLSKLPPGISPFEKSLSKQVNIQEIIRTSASGAIKKALDDNIILIEIDFPPLCGGSQSKSQFDDFDNVQELNANRDWCIQIIPTLKTLVANAKSIWFILPDDKEVELAKNTWGNSQLYTRSCKFTSIRAVCEIVLNNSNNNNVVYTKAWGSTIASTLNKLSGGDGILANSSMLDTTLSKTEQRIQLICQPGNGGPVEDWINVEQIHYAGCSTGSSTSSASDSTTSNNNINNNPTIIVNGALDKVRDGYYPSIFFPKLGKTISFYKKFIPIYILKPITYKGYYGWLYRVYPEPYQVVLQYPVKNSDDSTINKIQDYVALTSTTRPSYQECTNAIIAKALEIFNNNK